jgi:hypothetical protein
MKQKEKEEGKQYSTQEMVSLSESSKRIFFPIHFIGKAFWLEKCGS